MVERFDIRMRTTKMSGIVRVPVGRVGVRYAGILDLAACRSCRAWIVVLTLPFLMVAELMVGVGARALPAAG